MAFGPILFTGKQEVYSEPIDVGKSHQKVIDTIIGEKRRREDKALQREQNFIRNANIDPIQVASEDLMDLQMGLLEGYNQKWSKAYKDANGELSIDKKMEMQKDRNRIEAQQGKIQQSMGRLNEAYNIVSNPKNRGYYDLERFEADAENIRRTGEGGQLLYVKGVSPSSLWAKGLAKGVASQTDVITTKRGSKDVTVTESAVLDENTARQAVRLGIMSDEQLTIGAGEDFLKLPVEEQDKWHKLADENNDGVFSPAERQNAVMLYQEEKLYPYAMGVKRKTQTKPSAVKAVGKIGTEKNPVVKVESAVKMGNNEYNDFYQAQSTTKPFTISNYRPVSGLDEDVDASQNIEINSTVNGKLLGADFEKGEILIQVERDKITEEGMAFKSDVIAIPLEENKHNLRGKFFKKDGKSLNSEQMIKLYKGAEDTFDVSGAKYTMDQLLQSYKKKYPDTSDEELKEAIRKQFKK